MLTSEFGHRPFVRLPQCKLIVIMSQRNKKFSAHLAVIPRSHTVYEVTYAHGWPESGVSMRLCAHQPALSPTLYTALQR